MIAMAALFVGPVSAVQLAVCPDNSVLPGPIAGLGDMESCGQTVTTGANSVEINVGPTSIIGNIPGLESWLGLSSGTLAPKLPFEYKPFGGSAAFFTGFGSNPGDLLQFSWTGEYEPQATAYLFYALDNTVTVLDSQMGSFNKTMLPPDATLQLPQSVSVPLGAGNHSLVFGVIVGSPIFESCIECPIPTEREIIFDPILSITNLSVGPTAVPEPGTIALFGLGLLGLGALRRKRS